MQSPRAPLPRVPPRSTSLRRPRLLGQYHVLGEIGRSAVGPLHLARLEGTQGFQRWAAIRMVDQVRARDSIFMSEFFERARQGAALLHPNVAALFDVGETDGTSWLATEHLLGERLEELIGRVQLADTPVSWDVAARIVADAAEGLHAVHCHTRADGTPLGLLHGDVAPHSIVVTFDGSTKIKGAFEPRARGTLDRRKLAYAAPEQIWSEAVDARTDVFALGVILWELCAGQRLFARETDDETRARVEAGEVPSLGDEVPGFPAEIDGVVRRALAHRKEDRFATARDLSRALESALVARGVLVRSDDVAGYMRTMFADTFAERDAQLREASDVTEVFLKSRHAVRIGIPDSLASDFEAEPTMVNDPPTAPTRRAPHRPRAPSVDDLAATQERPNAQAELGPFTAPPAPPSLAARLAPAAAPAPPTFELRAHVDRLDAGSQVWVRPGARPAPPPPDPSYISHMTPIAPFELELPDTPPAPALAPQPPAFSQGALDDDGPVIPLGARIMPALPPATPGPYRIPGYPRSQNVRAALIGGGVGLVLFLGFIVLVRAFTNEDPTPLTAAPSASAAAPSLPQSSVTHAATQPAAPAPTTVAPTTAATTTAAPAPAPTPQPAAPPPASTTLASRPTPAVNVTSLPVSPPKATPAPQPTPPQPARTGLLTVVCTPACTDVIDGGHSLGPSPIFKQSVAAGRHQLTLRGEGGSRKLVSVEVTAGATAVVRQGI